jgi:hypothetical protein
MRTRVRLSSLLALATLSLAACNDTPSPADTGTGGTDAGATATCTAPGMPTAGAADTHCAPGIVQPTDMASCFGEPDAGPVDAGPAEDAGPAVDAGPIAACEYGATMFGMEADDDDCKYHLRWTATPICEGSGGVEFTLVATSKVDGSPVTGAGPRIQAFVTDGAACDTSLTHLSPAAGTMRETSTPGTYVGRTIFDQAGQWTVRFHLFEECGDTETSPHGHAAFRLTVP